SLFQKSLAPTLLLLPLVPTAPTARIVPLLPILRSEILHGLPLPITATPKLQQPTPVFGGATDGDGLCERELNPGGVHGTALGVGEGARRGRHVGRALVGQWHCFGSASAAGFSLQCSRNSDGISSWRDGAAARCPDLPTAR